MGLVQAWHMVTTAAFGGLFCAGSGCTLDSLEERTPFVPEAHPLYIRLEAPDRENDCDIDDDCLMSGCSSEVCVAEPVATTCELPAGGWPIEEASCGCVEGTCTWYSTDGTRAPVVAANPVPAL